MSDRRYPADVAADFPEPPISFVDNAGREIEIRTFAGEADGERSERATEERNALVEMYTEFDPADRAQGIPPGNERSIGTWLGKILSPACYNVIAWHGEDAVGHATLVPDNADYELAIFVLQSHQEAGIGTKLITGLLGHGQAEGVERVWLSVERWNRAAIALYEKIGFRPSDAESFELEMTLRLGGETD